MSPLVCVNAKNNRGDSRSTAPSYTIFTHRFRRPTIFQIKPTFSKPTKFKQKCWTDTIIGYQHEAKKLTKCILNNRKLLGRPYSWFVTIYVWPVMPPAEAAALWTKTCRSLRNQGIVALWVREPTRKNKIHYHLIVSSRQSREELVEAIETAMPSRKKTGWHKNIEPVDDDPTLAYYITKAKMRGKVRGKVVPDKYASKRLLFKTGTKLHKHRTIGDFWLKPTKEIWQEVRDTEKRIAEGLSDYRVRRLARRVHEMIGGCVEFKQIERNFGYFANTPAIQDQIAATANLQVFPT
jgi:hypothetical protein